MEGNAGGSQGDDAVGNVSGRSDPKSLEFFDSSFYWTDYAVEQALIAKKNVAVTLEHAVEVTRSRIDRFLTTGSVHFDQTKDMLQDSFQDVKSEYFKYEDIAFGKVKEGILLASSHPFLATGAALGVGFLGLKSSRQLVYYKTMRLFLSEEALITRAEAKVKELKKSIDTLKLDGDKLEMTAVKAEEDLVRGRTKLKQAGKQIRSAISSAYKIERQASGLKDVLQYLPSLEASRFRKQVTSLGKEAKKERNGLTEEVSKISNYGISV